MKQKIELLLKKIRRTKGELALAFGISRQGLDYKLNNDSFSHNDIKLLSDFFGIDDKYFLASDETDIQSLVDRPTLKQDSLLLTVEKIEKGFAIIEENYKSLLDQKDEVIKTQNFMIKILLEKSGSTLNFPKPVKGGVLPLHTSLNVA